MTGQVLLETLAWGSGYLTPCIYTGIFVPIVTPAALSAAPQPPEEEWEASQVPVLPGEELDPTLLGRLGPFPAPSSLGPPA